MSHLAQGANSDENSFLSHARPPHRSLARSFVAAIPAFLLPLIIVGGIIGGVFTPTEAAAVAAFIGLLISRYVYREIEFRALPAILLRAAAVSASIMMIIATASVFSWLIAIQNLPATIADALLGITDSPLLIDLFPVCPGHDIADTYLSFPQE